MSDWIDVPEPITWTLREPMMHNGVSYATITLRAPTGEDMMKASAVRGASNIEVVHRLVETVSGVPYDVLKKIPEWMTSQMASYFDEFAGQPMPDPLEQWRKDRREAARVATLPPPDETAPPS